MNKLLLLLFATALFQVNAQLEVSNPVTNVFHITCLDYLYFENAIEVPEGEFWTVYTNGNTAWRYEIPNVDYSFGVNTVPGNTVLSEGCKLYYDPSRGSCSPSSNRSVIIKVYKYSTDEALSYNDFEPLKDRTKLFPNPTTNQLALNSDKVYQIEVFDLTGNKVMGLKGNTINVEHLSNATYIVNAIDLETKESLSYKLVKK
jgi:hypothetical protein